MADYKFCAECGYEHDEFGRTREENEAREKEQQMETSKPKSVQLREARDQMRQLVARTKLDNPTLTVDYIRQVALEPTPAVLRLQKQFTYLGTQPQVIRDKETGETQTIEVGDVVAALVRTACDALYAIHDAADCGAAIQTLLLEVHEQVHEHFMKNRERIDREIRLQQQLMENLVMLAEAEAEEAIAEAEAEEKAAQTMVEAQTFEQGVESGRIPLKESNFEEVPRERELSAEEKAAAKRAEQALMVALSKQSKGQVH